MKKTLLLSALLFSFFTSNAQQTQTASVEEFIYGIQAGLLGVWVHNERKLSNTIVLRSAVGLDLDGKVNIYLGNSEIHEIATYIGPMITLEPRWYYNLNARLSEGKSIANNSGNFVGLNISYHPDWFAIFNSENINVPNQISIIPKWAIKRTTGKHFTYEFGAGIGYQYTFYDAVYLEDEGGVALDLHVRLGYTF